MIDFSLTSPIATALFVLAVLAGYQYRKVWKKQGPRWQAWLFGGIAGFCLLFVALTPISAG